MNSSSLTDLLSAAGGAPSLSLHHVISALLLSFVLCSVVAKLYQLTFQSLSYSRAFVHTLILGGMITCMVMMSLGDSLARGVGVLGALSLIRFRTVVRDPRDMIFLFAALATGIACGATVYSVAIISSLSVGLAALFLHFSPFASRRNFEGLLRFNAMPEKAVQDRVEELLEEFCREFTLVAMRDSSQGELCEYAYHVQLRDPSFRSDLVEAIKKNGVASDPTLLIHRTTVEL